VRFTGTINIISTVHVSFQEQIHLEVHLCQEVEGRIG
jgi:hypothetical protein